MIHQWKRVKKKQRIWIEEQNSFLLLRLNSFPPLFPPYTLLNRVANQKALLGFLETDSLTICSNRRSIIISWIDNFQREMQDSVLDQLTDHL